MRITLTPEHLSIRHSQDTPISAGVLRPMVSGAPIDIHIDLETGDPDDVMMLALLATHPYSSLRSVTVFPGGRDQVGVVKHVLARLGRSDVLVGAPPNMEDGKARVSKFHYRWLGQIPPADADGSAVEIITNTLENYSSVTLVTGAPLRNIAAAYRTNPRRWFCDWTCQGGFAGVGTVPPELILPKFAGMTTCPTYNLNADLYAASVLLFGRRRPEVIRMVSKNVCHGVFFSPADIERAPKGAHAGLDLMLEGMTRYCERHPEGKALHDVVAAVLTLRTTQAGIWVRGSPYMVRGCWGFTRADEYLENETDMFISVGLNRAAFDQALVG